MGKKKYSDKEVREALLKALVKTKRVKKECCQSKPRCKKCPVLAMRKIKSIMDSIENDEKSSRLAETQNTNSSSVRPPRGLLAFKFNQ